MKMQIETIPHEQQRYPTVGDWYTKDGIQHITVSKMSDERYEFLVAIHELIEAYVAQHDGIKEIEVDEFDAEYGDGEPGDDLSCPYYKQHQLASGIERIVAAALNVDWNSYNEEVDGL